MMKTSSRIPPPVAALAVLVLSHLASAHSWVERTMRIAPNGTMVGTPGYARNLVPRDTPGYTETKITGQIPPNGRSTGNAILPDDKIARPGQRTINYSEKWPMLNVAPGDYVAMQFQENGHVSMPLNQVNKTLNRGTVYVYGTTHGDLSNANLVDVHLKWNEDGTGGDKKGRLMATRNFDDGQCYEAGNGGDISNQRKAKFSKKAADPMGTNLWCQTDVQVPANASVGSTYTMLWVWDWPTMTQANVPVPPAYIKGFGQPAKPDDPKIAISEYYVSVVDFKVVDPCDASLGAVKGPTCNSDAKPGGNTNHINFASQPDLNVAAISDQLNNPFQVPIGKGSAASAPANQAPGGNGNPTNPQAVQDPPPPPASTTPALPPPAAPSCVAVTVTVTSYVQYMPTTSTVPVMGSATSSTGPVATPARRHPHPGSAL